MVFGATGTWKERQKDYFVAPLLPAWLNDLKLFFGLVFPLKMAKTRKSKLF